MTPKQLLNKYISFQTFYIIFYKQDNPQERLPNSEPNGYTKKDEKVFEEILLELRVQYILIKTKLKSNPIYIYHIFQIEVRPIFYYTQLIVGCGWVKLSERNS